MAKFFSTIGRVTTGVLTLGASEIPVGKSTLGQVSGVTPFVTTTVSGGITSGIQPGQSTLGVPSTVAKPLFEITGKVVTAAAGVSAVVAAGNIPSSLVPAAAPLAATALNSAALLDTAPKATAVATPAPRTAIAIPVVSASQPVDPNSVTTWYPATSVSSGGTIAGDASLDPALFDYYNKPQQTQPADWKPLVLIVLLAGGIVILAARKVPR